MPPRQALGLILAFVLILGGRSLRERILLDDNGLLKSELWLDPLVHPAVKLAAGASDAMAAPAPEALTAPLPINTCSEDSLQLLPGVGEVMAGRIATFRSTGGRFACRKDLEKVKGIGPALSARLDTLVVYTVAAGDTL